MTGRRWLASEVVESMVPVLAQYVVVLFPRDGEALCFGWQEHEKPFRLLLGNGSYVPFDEVPLQPHGCWFKFGHYRTVWPEKPILFDHLASMQQAYQGFYHK